MLERIFKYDKRVFEGMMTSFIKKVYKVDVENPEVSHIDFITLLNRLI